tara:strand:+ start:2524 stop:2946 length:423 start_codon:yes stop_codon:yes gene_type:complete
MSWLFNGKVFCQDGIPQGAIGFVYQMSAIIAGKSVSYIGKKNFYANVKTKLSKKAMPTDKRLKKYKRVTKTSYQDYYSSNDVLKQAHKENVVIKREILKICYSKNELTYQEVKHQFLLGVLESDLYLNRNILGRFYKNKI